MKAAISRTVNKIRNEKLLSKGETFCLVFIVVLAICLALWLGGLFTDGMASRQTGTVLNLLDFLADFQNVVGYSAKLDPYHSWAYSGPSEKAYPPLVYLIFYLFSRLVDMDQCYLPDIDQYIFLNLYKEPLMIFMFMIVTIGIYVALYESIRNVLKIRRLYAVPIAFLILFSGPMLFSLERGNTVIVAMVLLSIFLFNYDSDSGVKREIAIISLALSAAFKMTPAILGILLFTGRRKENKGLIIRAIIYGILAFGLPFFFLNDNPFRSGIQLIRNIQGNLAAYSRWGGVTLEACLLGVGLKIDGTILTILKYLVCAIMTVGVFMTKEKWKQVMLISLVLVTLPNHSGYYCILYMIPAFVLFLKEKEHKGIDWLILLSAIYILQPYQGIFLGHIFSTQACVLIMICAMLFYMVSSAKRLQSRKQ